MTSPETQRGGVRLPLQTGATCITAVGWVGALAWPPVLVLGGLFLARDGAAALAWVEMAIGVAVMTVPWTLYNYRLAKRTRPSDILLDAEGVHVLDRGPAAVEVPWSQIASCEVILKKDAWYGKNTASRWALYLRTPSDDYDTPPDIADARNEQERLSLEALAETIESLAKAMQQPAAPPAQSGARAHLACPRCGAPATPADAPLLACAFCGGQIQVPAELRERIHAAAETMRARASIRRDAARLFSSTHIGRVRGVLMATVAVACVAWPAAALFELALYARGQLAVAPSVLAAAVPLLLVAATCQLGMGVVVDRRALAILTLDFAAVPPTRPGEPSTCRNCRAPLPAPGPADVVVSCLHCGVDNLFGVDLRADARRSTAQADSLEDALAERRRARTAWRTSGLITGGLCAAASIGVVALSFAAQPLTLSAPARDLRRITRDPLEDATGVSVSPDGRRVAFTETHWASSSRRQHGVAVVEASGGGGDRVAPYCKDPMWIDGSTLMARCSDGTKAGSVDGLFGGGWEQAAHAIGLLPHTVWECTKPGATKRPWSHEFRFSQPRPGHAGEFSLVVDTSGPAGMCTDAPCAAIATVKDGQGLVRCIEAGVNPVWSADGKHLAWLPKSDAAEIRAVDVDAPNAAPSELAGEDECAVKDLALSPDGSRVAFVSRCGARDSIWTARVDGSDRRRIVTGAADVTGLSWTGSRLFFGADDSIYSAALE